MLKNRLVLTSLLPVVAVEEVAEVVVVEYHPTTPIHVPIEPQVAVKVSDDTYIHTHCTHCYVARLSGNMHIACWIFPSISPCLVISLCTIILQLKIMKMLNVKFLSFMSSVFDLDKKTKKKKKTKEQ